MIYLFHIFSLFFYCGFIYSLPPSLSYAETILVSIRSKLTDGSVLNLFLRVNIITQNSLKAVLGVGSVPHHEKRSEVG